MQAHQIFQAIEEETADSVVQFIRENHRDVYKASMASLAIERKMRPVFIQKKPAASQISWIGKQLRVRGSNGIGEHLLQLWLLKAHRDLIIQFLGEMEIEHDGEGGVDDLPEKLDEGKLETAVDGLFEKFPPEVVTIYLHVFQMQTPEGWSELEDLLGKDERLTIRLESK